MITFSSPRRIGTGPGIHAYFDVIPESPDGTHATWFAFDGKPLDHGRVMVARRDGSDARAVYECAGIVHCGAFQGWLDNDHVYLSTDGRVVIVGIDGRVTNTFDGAVDTIHRGSRSGLMHSHGLRETCRGADTPVEACWRVNLDTGEKQQLLERTQAVELVGDHVDLSGIETDTLTFKHTKWSPDGTAWFVVFNNERYWKTAPDIPRVKVLLAADSDGSNLRYIGPFGHHPDWLPDSSGIYAFTQNGVIHQWDAHTGERTVLTDMPCEGHPSLSPDGQYLATDGHNYPAPGQDSVVVKDLQDGSVTTVITVTPPAAPWQKSHPRGSIGHRHPVWSHDGQRLYYNGIEDGLPALYCVDKRE